MSKFTATLEEIIRSTGDIRYYGKVVVTARRTADNHYKLYTDNWPQDATLVAKLPCDLVIEINEHGLADAIHGGVNHQLLIQSSRPFTKADVLPPETAPPAVKGPRLAADSETIVCLLSEALDAALVRNLHGYKIVAVIVHPATVEDPRRIELEVETASPSIVETRIFDDRQIRIDKGGQTWLQFDDEDGTSKRVAFHFYTSEHTLRPLVLADFSPALNPRNVSMPVPYEKPRETDEPTPSVSVETRPDHVFDEYLTTSPHSETDLSKSTADIAPLGDVSLIRARETFRCLLRDAYYASTTVHLNELVVVGFATDIPGKMVFETHPAAYLEFPDDQSVEVDEKGYAKVTQDGKDYCFRFEASHPLTLLDLGEWLAPAANPTGVTITSNPQ